jgi:hypothetical protein
MTDFSKSSFLGKWKPLSGGFLFCIKKKVIFVRLFVDWFVAFPIHLE